MIHQQKQPIQTKKQSNNIYIYRIPLSISWTREWFEGFSHQQEEQADRYACDDTTSRARSLVFAIFYSMKKTHTRRKKPKHQDLSPPDSHHGATRTPSKLLMKQSKTRREETTHEKHVLHTNKTKERAGRLLTHHGHSSSSAITAHGCT